MVFSLLDVYQTVAKIAFQKHIFPFGKIKKWSLVCIAFLKESRLTIFSCYFQISFNTLNIRLSYNDMRLFKGILNSLPQQALQAKSQTQPKNAPKMTYPGKWTNSCFCFGSKHWHVAQLPIYWRKWQTLFVLWCLVFRKKAGFWWISGCAATFDFGFQTLDGLSSGMIALTNASPIHSGAAIRNFQNGAARPGMYLGAGYLASKACS